MIFLDTKSKVGVEIKEFCDCFYGSLLCPLFCTSASKLADIENLEIV